MSTLQVNMLQEGRPSASALGVAELRAVHQLLDDPVVFDDPLALRILGKRREAELRADPSAFNDPLRRGLRAMLAVRSRLAEDELAHAIETGVRQYVVLGAGLDTFAYRNVHAASGLRVFEVDHPSTQAWKKDMLAVSGISVPPSMSFVGVDFEADTLAGRLQHAGFRADQPAFFSWLGVTVYLAPDVVLDTLRYIASLPRNSGIVFDYRADPVLLNAIDRAAGDFLGKVMAERGEPWRSSFDPQTLQEQLHALGFVTATSLSPDELNNRFLARRKDGLRVVGGVRMMCAVV